MLLDEPLIFERGSPGRVGWMLPAAPASIEPPRELRREDDLVGMPEVSELEVVRHFVRLSQWNYSAATTLYPLGSCTMKYNPVVHEALVRLPGFSALHPLVPDELASYIALNVSQSSTAPLPSPRMGQSFAITSAASMLSALMTL